MTAHPRRRRVALGALLRRSPSPRMRPRGLGRHFEALVLADVDLDAGTVTPQPTRTPYAREPEGVHAVVWFHGEPLGELTLPGPPRTLLSSLPSAAEQAVAGALHEHRIRDRLAAPRLFRQGPARETGGSPPPPLHDDAPSQVTVAVCTRDRAEDLRECLEAIGALRAPVGEVLVVDNASTDGRTREVAAEFPFVRYVWEPRLGLSWARNRALLEARTPVLAFTDDDVVVHPLWVDGLLRAFSEEPAATVVTGLVIPLELATPAQVLFEAEGGFGRGYRRQYFAAAVEQGEVAARGHADIGRAGTGANMAVLREPTLRLGGFDTALGVGTPTSGCDDLEFFFRVIAAGDLIVYEPTAVVRHRHRPTMDGLLRQRRGDGSGSYSWLLGAGRGYGRVQAGEFRAFAARWVYRRHLRSTVRSLRWPTLWPPALARAEAAGAAAAILRRQYRRAVRQAAAQSARHPREPTAPPLVRTPARRDGVPVPPAAVRIDLARNPLQHGTEAVYLPSPTASVSVSVSDAGTPMSTFVVSTSGAGLSTARLRIEVAARLAAGYGGRGPVPSPDGEPTGARARDQAARPSPTRAETSTG